MKQSFKKSAERAIFRHSWARDCVEFITRYQKFHLKAGLFKYVECFFECKAFSEWLNVKGHGVFIWDSVP